MPEKIIKEAQKAYKKKDFLVAAENFRSAAEVYARSKEPLSAAEMLNNASVAFLQAGRAQEAFETASGTDRVFASADDTRRQAIALGNQAAALEALGKLDDAVGLYENSADLLKKSGDQELRSTVLQSLSAVQLRLGRQLEAMASMQAGLESIEHPSLKQRIVKKILRSPLDYLGRSS
jgi:tetratricopeptide (TPR) repeat protein